MKHIICNQGVEKVKNIADIIKKYGKYLLLLLRWMAISTVVGIVCGLVGTAFDFAVEFATELRGAHSFLIYLLPLAGIVIVALYQLLKTQNEIGTDYIVDSIRTTDKIPLLLAPLIYIGTFLTHLCGGSAGREGAALQLGGSIAYNVGRIFKPSKKDMSLIVLSGMSGVFAALFGTPITAAIFALEVVSVGTIYYSGLIPCLTSAGIAYAVAHLSGVKAVRFSIEAIPDFTALSILKTVVVAALCAIISVVFCKAIKHSKELFAKVIKNHYLRALLGGLIIVLLSLVFSSHDYNGAGMDVISKAISGEAVPWAFAVKILFTAVTIGSGFKGGEIVPCFFIGSTFGCAVGSLIGLNPCFAAAIGLVAMFCGSVNCPIASIFLSIELFGAGGIIYFALACAISYVLSGYTGLYDTQKIIYSKYTAEYINKAAE